MGSQLNHNLAVLPVISIDGGLYEPLAPGQPQPEVEEGGAEEWQLAELVSGREDI